MSLIPTEKTEKCTSFEDYDLIIYGPSDVGKTSFALQSPNSILVDGEGGVKAFGDFYKFPPEKDKRVEKWSTLKEFNNEMLRGNHQFKTIIYDGGDAMYSLCTKWVLGTEWEKAKKKKKDLPMYESPIDLGIGGWGMINSAFVWEFKRMMARFRIIIVLHHKQDEVKQIVGSDYKKDTMLLGPSCREALKGAVNVVIYTEMNGTGQSEILMQRLKERDVKIQGITPDQRAKFPNRLPLDYGVFKETFEKALRGEL